MSVEADGRDRRMTIDLPEVQSMAEVAKRITGFDVTGKLGRRFLKEGNIVKITSKGQSRSRVLFLFTDLLIWCSPPSLLSSGFKFHKLLSLQAAEVQVFERPNKKCVTFSVNTPDRQEPAIFLCGSTRTRDAWIEALDICISKLQGGKRRKNRRRERKPKWWLNLCQ